MLRTVLSHRYWAQKLLQHHKPEVKNYIQNACRLCSTGSINNDNDVSQISQTSSNNVRHNLRKSKTSTSDEGHDFDSTNQNFTRDRFKTFNTKSKNSRNVASQSEVDDDSAATLDSDDWHKSKALFKSKSVSENSEKSVEVEQDWGDTFGTMADHESEIKLSAADEQE